MKKVLILALTVFLSSICFSQQKAQKEDFQKFETAYTNYQKVKNDSVQAIQAYEIVMVEYTALKEKFGDVVAQVKLLHPECIQHCYEVYLACIDNYCGWYTWKPQWCLDWCGVTQTGCLLGCYMNGQKPLPKK